MGTVGRRMVTINDGWAFAPEALTPSSTWADVWAVGEAVTLPHTWNAEDGQDGGNDYRRGAGTYARGLEWSADGTETWVEFRGVNASARVYLNGHLLAEHHGGYSTFRAQLTHHLEAENTLLVIVDNAPSDSVYPQRADFTFYGGIYRDVHLVTVPAAHFGLDAHGAPGMTVVPTLEDDAAHVALHADVTAGDQVRFTIDGVETATVPVDNGSAAGSITIPEVRRWHGIRDPFLYTATAELLVAGEVSDTVSLRFGCREFEVDPERGFLLNGESYPLRGVSRHQDWAGVGNAISRDMMATDLALLQELGATTVRLAHYQHDQHFYDLCDEAGIVVWAEIPQITEFLPKGVENARNQLTELIVQNRHHASIVCWGLSNEITVAGKSDASLAAHRELNELAHRLDPTRLTAMAHLFLLETDDPLVRVADVMSYNLYFGWYVGEVVDNDAWLDDFHARYPDVAIGLAEYGADANPRFQSAEPTRGDYSEQFQARYHEHMVEMIEAREWLWATHVWNLADFGADGRDEGGNPGRNQKGLVSFDRTVKKDAFYLYKAAWSNEPFVHVSGRRHVDRAQETTEVTVYSNQSRVALYRDGELIGEQEGRRVFRFHVDLTGEHQLQARAGELTDTITVRRVAEPNPAYRMEVATVINWFDDELPAPEGFYSINDTLADIKRNEQGAQLVQHMMAGLTAAMGDVAQKVEIPPAMQAMIERQTVASLLRQAGAMVPPEQIKAINTQLNSIAK